MDIVFHAHSGLRYLVLLAGVVAAGYALAGWARGRDYDRTGALLGRIFVGVLDLQVLLGLVLLTATFYPALIGHITMMVLAAVAAHGFQIAQKRRRAEARSFALQFVGLAIALLLIVGGILAIGRPII